MRHGRTTVAARSNDRPRRRGFPLGIVGVLVLIALVAAYLSDCLPGLGAGGKLGTPSSDAPAASRGASEAPAEGKGAGEAAGDRITIVVRGEQCRRGEAEPEPCPRLCAALDRTHAATVEVAVEAVEGRHGTVEALRKCLRDAGFTRVRVHSE